ncbi:MAG: V-type ATP synthase subunit D [Clostridia bacterium]|nr:V-type ATP synthase subunit D [Clostridia bacterium]
MPKRSLNSTRMELNKLKKKLIVARRGHKLLKDKRDEMMRQFLIYIEENKNLRLKVENAIRVANKNFALAQSEMTKENLDLALMSPKQSLYIDISYKNIMSVKVPQFSIKTRTSEHSDIFPYSFAMTSAALDKAIMDLSEVFGDMIKLAQTERTCQMLSSEIEKTNRRVNALEYVVIPETQESIKYISMKIEESERSNAVRLIKVKDLVLNEK